MKENILNSKKLISNLSEEQLDELMVYAPPLSETSLANIEARYFEKISGKQNKNTGRKFSMKKFATIAAAAIMLFATTTVVLATMFDLDLGDIFNSFFRNPAATNVMEVGVTAYDNGIEITMQYAHTDGQHVYAMLELRDLQGNRLCEDTKLMFCWTNMANVITPVVYDETQNRIIVGIGTMFSLSSIEIGDYVTISIMSILSGAGFIEFEPLEFELYQHVTEQTMIPRAEWEKTVLYREQNPRQTTVGMAWDWTYLTEEPEWFLEIGELDISIPGIDWAVITNIGFYNGLLHIQTRRTDTWDWTTNHGRFNLVDRDGVGRSLSFGLNGEMYQEHVFVIGDIENISDMRLSFTGVMVDEVIYGDWTFTFPITALAKTAYFTTEMQGTELFSQMGINISPMATSLHLTVTDNFVTMEDYDGDLWEFIARKNAYGERFETTYITLKDGSRVELFLTSRWIAPYPQGGEFIFNSRYFDMTQLHSITIFDVEYLIPDEARGMQRLSRFPQIEVEPWTNETELSAHEMNQMQNSLVEIGLMLLEQERGVRGSLHISRLVSDEPPRIYTEADVDILLNVFRIIHEHGIAGFSWDTCIDDAIYEAGLEDYFWSGRSKIMQPAIDHWLTELATNATKDELVEMGMLPYMLEAFQALGFFLDETEARILTGPIVIRDSWLYIEPFDIFMYDIEDIWWQLPDVVVDGVEILTSEQLVEHGLQPEDFHRWSYFRRSSNEETLRLEITEDTVFIFTDVGFNFIEDEPESNPERQATVNLEDFIRYLYIYEAFWTVPTHPILDPENIGTGFGRTNTVAYFVTITGNEVVSVFELFLFTQ